MTKKRKLKNDVDFKKESEDLNTVVSQLRRQIGVLEEQLEESENQRERAQDRITQLEQQFALERRSYVSKTEKVQLHLDIRQALCGLRATINQDLFPHARDVKTMGHTRAWNDAQPENQQ